MTDREAENARAPVRRRRVYYISGYDPQGPRRYHRLYRAEAAAQAKISGYKIAVGDLVYEPGRDAARWTAGIRDGGTETTAEIVILRWDDIARNWMRKSIPAVYVLMARTFWRYVGSGAFRALTRIRMLSTWVGMYPVAALTLYFLASLCAGGVAICAWAELTGLPRWSGAPAGAALAYGLMWALRALDDHTLVYYLMCDFGFTAAHSESEAPEMEARIDAFARRVYDDWAKGDCDEALIVGHSSGAAYAASVAARAVALGADKRTGPHLSFLSIGQTIPMLSFLPGAERLREDLRALGRSDAVDWVDVSSPADGGCYALSDPVGVSGAAPPRRARRNPKVVSARFWDALSPEKKDEIKNRWFRIHIQYLCAFDRPQDYDYFQITAGVLRLADRFAARRESPRLKGAPFIPQPLRA